MRKSRTAILAAMLLTGCTTAPNIPATVPSPLSAAQTSAIKSAVTAKLKDPGSVQFGTILAGREVNGRAITVCGLVNAKNSYGGYTGMTPFSGEFTSADTFRVGGIGGVPEVSTAIFQVCSRQGMPL